VADNDRQRIPLRLTPEHMRDLEKASKICGQTKQAFVQSAVLAEVAEVLDRNRTKRNRLRPFAHDSSQEQESIGSGLVAPTSTLLESLRQRNATPTETPTTPSTQGQVIVNVGGSSASAPNSDIDRLAAFVVNGGNDLERETRMRTAVNILRASSTTDEERKVLAARLDEAVAAKTKTPPLSEGDGVVRTARVAFDKLADLWKGI
jgi:hypothetical protein